MVWKVVFLDYSFDLRKIEVLHPIPARSQFMDHLPERQRIPANHCVECFDEVPIAVVVRTLIDVPDKTR